MQPDNFEFRGTGFSYLWLLIWTSFLSVITLGLFVPWSYTAQHRWLAANTFVNGRQLVYNGTGLSLLGQWLLIILLEIITLGIYTPWACCKMKRWELEHTDFADCQSTLVTGQTSINV